MITIRRNTTNIYEIKGKPTDPTGASIVGGMTASIMAFRKINLDLTIIYAQVPR